MPKESIINNIIPTKINSHKFMENEISTEGYVFSEPDYRYLVETWRPKGNNILFVTGLSGGGKSTMAGINSQFYNASMFHLDDIDFAADIINELKNTKNDKSDNVPTFSETIVIQFFDKHPEKDPKDTIENFNLFSEVAEYAYNKFTNRKNHHDLFIIEGYQIPYLYYEYPEWKEVLLRSPIYIKNTSALMSHYRKGKRNMIRYGEKNPKIFDYQSDNPLERYFQSIINSLKTEKSFKPFKKDLKTSNRNIKSYGLI